MRKLLVGVLLFGLWVGLCLSGMHCLMFIGVADLVVVGIVRCGDGLVGWL